MKSLWMMCREKYMGEKYVQEEFLDEESLDEMYMECLKKVYG